MLRGLALAVAIAACWPAPAHAQSPQAEGVALEEQPTDAEDLEDREARARFEAGRLAFVQGRYEDALESFERAYELSERPHLLFNIGVSADRLGRERKALEAFEGFVEAVPDYERRELIENRIDVLRERVAEAEAAQAQQGTVDTDPGAGPWVIVAASGAVAVAGAALLAVALRDKSDIENLDDPTPWPEIEKEADRVPVLSGVGVGALGLGVAGVAAGLAWELTAGGGGETGVAVEPTANGLRLRGCF